MTLDEFRSELLVDIDFFVTKRQELHKVTPLRYSVKIDDPYISVKIDDPYIWYNVFIKYLEGRRDLKEYIRTKMY